MSSRIVWKEKAFATFLIDGEIVIKEVELPEPGLERVKFECELAQQGTYPHHLPVGSFIIFEDAEPLCERQKK